MLTIFTANATPLTGTLLVPTYATYLLLSVVLTVWVARTLA